jgi:hypothetical protein
VRELRLLTVFLAAFGLTVLGVTAAAYALPPWVKVVFALPALVARSLSG